MTRGKTGATGTRGAKGVRGAAGPVGFRGATGKPGAKGLKGKRGPVHKGDTLDTLVMHFEDVYRELTDLRRRVDKHEHRLNDLSEARGRHPAQEHVSGHSSPDRAMERTRAKQ